MNDFYNLPYDEPASKVIEDFLAFLKHAREDKNFAKDNITQCDDASQDLLHYIEFEKDCGRKLHADINIKLSEVRRCRRIAKIVEEEMEPIVKWSNENLHVIKSLEQLLGELRKVEENRTSRRYYPRTKVLDNLPSIPEIVDPITEPSPIEKVTPPNIPKFTYGKGKRKKK